MSSNSVAGFFFNSAINPRSLPSLGEIPYSRRGDVESERSNGLILVDFIVLPFGRRQELTVTCDVFAL